MAQKLIASDLRLNSGVTCYYSFMVSVVQGIFIVFASAVKTNATICRISCCKLSAR